eukprot:TRINITY_DN6590_c0_g2_i2.p2 TRINITY_DN6590_c0_g2~~TRINITY_DN6590_c0_g2_i2.p2  ORF type:complete len:228 (-),score=25.83 TRINITY_DN6590_c0_g2_i2:159-842(-)
MGHCLQKIIQRLFIYLYVSPIYIMNSYSCAWERIAKILESTVQSLEAARGPFFHSTCFDCIRVPKISLPEYLERIKSYSDCSDFCFVLAFIYIDRFLLNNPGSALSRRNIHRLLFAAIVLAIKYLDDIYFDNQTYAQIGGVPIRELNLMERAMLRALGYELYVSGELSLQYVEAIECQYQRLMASERRSEERLQRTSSEMAICMDSCCAVTKRKVLLCHSIHYYTCV